MALLLIALLLSIGAVAAILYSYRGSVGQTTVMITPAPVSAATIGTPILISANITGPSRNVTLVYGANTVGPVDQATMNQVAAGQYNYTIPANQVSGDIAYYIKAYDPGGRQFNTTTLHIAVADFSLQPQTNALTLYRTENVSIDAKLESLNSFNGELQLSTTGSPNGLMVSFSENPAPSGTMLHLNFAAAANTLNGTYPVTLLAIYRPSQAPQVIREAVIDVTIADFQLSITPSSSVVKPGSTANFAITLTLENGFTDSVKITDISGLPHGATYTLAANNPTVLAGNPGTTTVTLAVKVPANTKAGTYSIVIVALGGGIIHSLSAQITVR
jgi:hypothetical protein